MLQRSQSTTQSHDGVLLLMLLAIILIIQSRPKQSGASEIADVGDEILTPTQKRQNGSLLGKDKRLAILREQLYIETLESGEALIFVRDLTRSQTISIRSDDYRWTFKEVNVGLKIPRFGSVSIYYEDDLMIFEVYMQVDELFDLLGDFSIGEKISPPIILMEVS